MAELGYYLAEEYWGRGIMTEAIRQLCEIVFDTTDILRIYAEPFAYNTGSRRALEKAGYKAAKSSLLNRCAGQKDILLTSDICRA